MAGRRAEAGKVLRVETTRFGPLEVPVARLLAFPWGLFGFETQHRFFLLEVTGRSHSAGTPAAGKAGEASPFHWLQSVDDPDLAFVVADPYRFWPHYAPELPPAELAPLQLENVAQRALLVILTVPADPRRVTANLRAPIVANVASRCCRQVVAVDDTYSTREPLLPALRTTAGAAAPTPAPGRGPRCSS